MSSLAVGILVAVAVTVAGLFGALIGAVIAIDASGRVGAVREKIDGACPACEKIDGACPACCRREVVEFEAPLESVPTYPAKREVS